MSERNKFSVDGLSEGEWLVRGTLDPQLALSLVVDVMDEGDLESLLYGVSPGAHVDRPWYGDLDPEAVQRVADWCHHMIDSAVPGLYRKVHCLPNSYGAYHGWAWDLRPADARGPGVFEAVEFPC